MKKNYYVLQVFVLAMLFQLSGNLYAQTNSQTNFLQNGNFEATHGDNKQPNNWFVYPDNLAAEENPQFKQVEGTAPVGNFFLQMSKTGGKVPLDVVQIIDLKDEAGAKIAANLGKTLVLSGKARGVGLEVGDNGLVLQIFAQKSDGSRHFVGRVNGKLTGTSSEWQTVKVRVSLADVLPAGESLGYLDVMASLSSNTGHIDFDDLSLVFEN
jgi:hypothetical protein